MQFYTKSLCLMMLECALLFFNNSFKTKYYLVCLHHAILEKCSKIYKVLDPKIQNISTRLPTESKRKFYKRRLLGFIDYIAHSFLLVEYFWLRPCRYYDGFT